jgi:hypothetical protein
VVTFRAGESLALVLALAPVRDGIFLEDWNSSTVRPGFSLPIEVLVSAPEVARIQTSATGFTANTNRFVFTVIGVSPGQAQVRFRLPDGVTPPPPFDVTVTAGTIDLSASPVRAWPAGPSPTFQQLDRGASAPRIDEPVAPAVVSRSAARHRPPSRWMSFVETTLCCSCKPWMTRTVRRTYVCLVPF